MSRVVTITLTDQARILLAEAAGTFMFVAIGAGSVVAHYVTQGGIGILGIALAFGFALAVAVSVFGNISGAHLNPAVTLGLWIAGKHPRERILTYWGAQVAGALVAGIFLRIAFGHSVAAMAASQLGTPVVADGVTPLAAILVEAVLTMFLLWAVFGTAVSPSAPRIAGFGIGLAFAAGVLVGFPLTGAAMNPARWIGPAAAAGSFDHWYVYWVGPLLGGALGGLTYRYAFASDTERDPIVVSSTASTGRTASPPPPSQERTERL